MVFNQNMTNITIKTTKEELETIQHPCSCNACNNGCNHGSGVFTDNQIEPLAKYLNITKEELEKKYLEKTIRFNTTRFKPKVLRQGQKPYGKCIFFNEKNKCEIHSVKPLECKLAMPCKKYGEKISLWFMMNQFVNKNNAESVREYASYLKIGGKQLSGASLKELIPDHIKLKKILERKEKEFGK